MIRGGVFYAIWNDATGLWSTDEADVHRLIDDDLQKYVDAAKDLENPSVSIIIKWMRDFQNNSWVNYRRFIKSVYDNYTPLDSSLTFANTEIKKRDHVSKRLPYSLGHGSISAFEEIISTLYDPLERQKIEWTIGAIVSGDSKKIEKFLVLYGAQGAGKGTILNIIAKLFQGYCGIFDAKALGSSSDAFSMEAFRDNPLVALQYDGDLSRIEDNTKLNQIVSHESMRINEKHKATYNSRLHSFLIMGTNKAVKITDAYSGIIRRLIDANPSGRLVPQNRYQTLMSQIDFELGAIAQHCLDVYRSLGKNFYSGYRPIAMMYKTDMFFNFVADEVNFKVFLEQDVITLQQAFTMYKVYCDESSMEYRLRKPQFREELKNYFQTFSEVTRIDGKQTRSVYSGFLVEKFNQQEQTEEVPPCSLVLDSKTSLLDSALSNCLAQYATGDDIPGKKWDEVLSVLGEIDTGRVHYVRPPENHIVIDFDLLDEEGNKSLELNLQAASKFPATYAELSKGGAGVHLHYIWDGDVSRLSPLFEEGIEIKTFTGKSSLRRRLTKCNTIPIATIATGLPLKGEKVVINQKVVKSEKGLRDLIRRNLDKEFLPGTKPSIDFIHKILEDAYNQGMNYDVTDLRPKILSFANNSSRQADYCIKKVNDMKFASEEISMSPEYTSEELVFFDVEVYPNLFVVVWKAKGKRPVALVNPTAREIEQILGFKLVGFNCRRYDNHILYARLIGKDNRELFEISQRIINGSNNAMFGEAYNISYTDIFDFSSAQNKKGLKKWEIELGLYHMEMGIRWDEDVPPEKWDRVVEYCINDVLATEAVFDHPPIQGDWAARQILAELSGLTVNDTTNQHTIKIVFGTNRKPQDKFIYTDLSTMFPGYTFDMGKSTYKGVEVGEGGYVYAEPGMYENVAVLDVASQHPNSIRNMNMFGDEYTKRYTDLLAGRLAIKNRDMETLRNLLDGKLIPFIEEAQGENPRFTMKDVSTGLKTALNSAYGLTFAKFENPFRDTRNKDNIVAKRGALFMVELQHVLQDMGVQVVHIKTDSVKIPNAPQEIIDFIVDFGKQYGYDFEHETTYSKFCLVNDAVYISKDLHSGEWSATGAQFAHPYVFKTLFSKETANFKDLCEAKSVTTALYLDMGEEDYHFVGKVGSFCPIKPDRGGGLLVREKEGKYYAATGSKGYFWLESETVKNLDKQDDIDMGYFDGLADAAINNISKHGDFYDFIGEKKSCHGLCNNGGDCTNCVNCTCPANKNAPPWCEGSPCPNYNGGDCDHCYDDKNTPLHCLTSDCAKCPKSIDGGDCLPF